MSFQKCQKCDRPATHKFTRIINGEAADFYFCQKHAAQFSSFQQKAIANQMNLTQLLAGLLKSEQGQKTDSDEAATTDLKCQTCGLSYREYQQTMLLGCSDCYRAFEKQLRYDLRRYHGTVRHCGKQPMPETGKVSNCQRLEALKGRLTLAIQDEDFELAAQLRDEIRQMASSTDKPHGAATD